MSELQEKATCELANALKTSRQELGALETVINETKKELAEMKKERERERAEASEILQVIGATALRHETERLKLEDQAKSELANVENDLQNARSALEESKKELRAARNQIDEIQNKLTKVERQWDLLRDQLTDALDDGLSEPGAVPHQQELSQSPVMAESSDGPESDLSSTSPRLPSPSLRISRPVLQSRSRDVSAQSRSCSSNSSRMSTPCSSGALDAPDQMEDDRDNLWKMNRVFVPRGCTTFPGTLFARDVGYVFEHIEERKSAVIAQKFPHMVPGVKFVYATYRAQRFYWENSLPAEREAAKNLPREPRGSWAQWVQTSAARKLYNQRIREKRQSKARRARHESESDSGEEEEINNHKLKVDASPQGIKRRRELEVIESEVDELLSLPPRKKGPSAPLISPRLTRSSNHKK
ncbi:hypothetical protein C8R43DRAFT_1132438 [Mycena crocata]|nr:hypothetical protein C8R43DRAFT_1132438 [Mycena crocata]